MIIWNDNDRERDSPTPLEIVSLITLASSSGFLLSPSMF
jgi:hypothetical protein